jgi:hypothetical protein
MPEVETKSGNKTSLVDVYEYLPTRIRGRRGRPPSRRLMQLVIKKYDLPVARFGNTTLINPAKGDARLEEFAREAPPVRRGPGRPRTTLR